MKKQFYICLLLSFFPFSIHAALCLPSLFKGKKESLIGSIEEQAVWSEKPHISPDSVHIEKTGHNADTQTDIFQVKFTSSNNKEIQFELEIPKGRLEQNKLDIERNKLDIEGNKLDIEGNKLDIEEQRKGVFHEFAEEVREFAAFLREEDDLLLIIKKFVSQMSEESFQRGGRISLEELESMLISQYRNRVYQYFVQNYSTHYNSRLSHIGSENVHIIKKTVRYTNFPEYDIQFKTQRGKRIRFVLTVEAKMELSDEFVLATIRQGELDDQVLTVEQMMKLAIGQMPAETFKGLRSITVWGSNFKHGGQVRPVFPDMLIMGGETKIKYAYEFTVNDFVVHVWMRVTKSTKSEMDLAVNGLNKIPLSEGGDLTSNLAHELGHVLQNTQYSFPMMSKVIKSAESKEDISNQVDRMRVPKDWPDAIEKDGTSVSEYGDTNLSEDFAEAVRVYIQTDGGAKDPQALEDFANRFKILDKLMKTSMRERKSF